jgi:hypothetical protein
VNEDLFTEQYSILTFFGRRPLKKSYSQFLSKEHGDRRSSRR